VSTPSVTNTDPPACGPPRLEVPPGAMPPLVGVSTAFVAATAKIPAVAGCDAGVLVLGETGTGKELFARAVHYLSRRRTRPFVPVNCASLPVDLVENELFGHERAAYTGAHTTEPGLVAEADGGTLFLDEVDSLPLAAQAKLLRFLETKEYRRLGSPQLRRTDIRLVAATSCVLDQAVASGRFRRDLYYRLNVVQLLLPPLRARQADVPLLARHFLARYAREFDRALTGFTSEAMRLLVAHSWPGNVRELENTVQRAAILTEGREGLIAACDIDLHEQPDATQHESFKAAKRRAVADFERGYLEGVLALCLGNVSRAARTADKDRRSFWALVKKHGIDIHRYRAPESNL
jgi:two-component system, NtrC family, response regulator GlrR